MKIIKQKNHRKAIIVSIIIIILVAIGCSAIYFLKYNLPTSTSTGKSSSSANNKTSNSGSISSPKDIANKKTPVLDPTITPSDPTGTFVSNHHPNLSGSPAPNTESSTCSTTPGANCEIRFTSGNIVKLLIPKPTNSDGNASWDWKLQDIGLNKGEWKVTAIATNGNKEATVTDPMLLSVQE